MHGREGGQTDQFVRLGLGFQFRWQALALLRMLRRVGQPSPPRAQTVAWATAYSPNKPDNKL